MAPETNPIFGPKSMPKTQGRNASTLQWIAPGISGIGAVSKKPTPVIADVTAANATTFVKGIFSFTIFN
jgi:hypothetical protein